MKSKAKICLILLIFSLFNVSSVRAPPESQTVTITDTDDDGFVTEAGIGFDTSLVTVLDPNMDIRSYLVFRDIEINFWEPLTNATLRLHTSNTLTFEANSTITIYGVRQADFNGFGGPSDVISAPVTMESVSFNTSQFYGGAWHEIDVTDIIEELIRNPRWDGDGIGGTGPTDHIGFVIYGAEGFETRYFYDFKVGNSLEAQLVIHWNHSPPPPAGSGGLETYNGTYRGYDIWSLESEWLNYSSFTLVNPDGNIQNLNDTYFEYTTYYEDDDDYLRKSFSASGALNRKFGITYQVFKENTAAETSGIVTHWGISNRTGSPWGPPQWGEGYSIHTIQAAGGFTREKLQIINWVNGGHIEHLDLHPYWNDVDLPVTIWIDVNLNLDTGAYNIVLYNDMEMTSVNQTTNGIFGSVPDASLMTTEFAMGPTSSVSAFRDWETGLRLSNLAVGDSWTVTDENGTTICSDLETYEKALECVDNELGADPEDPDPPGQDWEVEGPFTRFRTRLYIWMIGIFLIFGPVFSFAYRRPSGYAFVIGLFIMLIGLGFMIAAGSV